MDPNVPLIKNKIPPQKPQERNFFKNVIKLSDVLVWIYCIWYVLKCNTHEDFCTFPIRILEGEKVVGSLKIFFRKIIDFLDFEQVHTQVEGILVVFE